MLHVLKNSWALFFGIMLLMAGNSLQSTLLGVRGKMENFDPNLMGIIMSSYFVGFAAGSRLTPILLRRVGHVRVFAAFASLVSAAFVIYASVVHPVSWAAMRFVVGMGFSGIYVVAESWLNDSATNETRGQTLSAYIIVQLLGVIVGQFLLGLADPGGYDLFIFISVIVSLSFAPILLSASPAPVYESGQAMSVGELLRISPLGCVGSLLVGAIFSAMFGMSAVYAGEKDFPLTQVSLFISSFYIGGMLLQYPIGWLSDRMDRRVLIIACALVTFVAGLAGTLLGDIFSMSLVAAFFIGGMANPIYSLLLAHTNDYLETSQMAAASSGLILLNGLGAMIGPVLIGTLMGYAGPPGFFMFIAGAAAILSVYGLYRKSVREAPSLEDAGFYQPLPATGATYVTAEIVQEVAIEEEEANDEEDVDLLDRLQEPGD